MGMTHLKICRICLRTEAKMFKINVYSLQLYYEEVLGHKITYESIYNVDRKKLKLISSLDMIHNIEADIILPAVDKNIQKNVIKRSKKSNHHKEEFREKVKKETHTIEHVSVDSEKVFCKAEVLIKTENNIEFPLPLEDENSLGSVDSDHLLIDSISTENIESKDQINHEGVFIVADNNKDVTVKKFKARRLKGTKCNISKSKSNKKGAWKLRELLKEGNWKMTTMSEEESLQTFRAKSQCDKYISAKYKCTDCFIFFSNNEMYMRHRLRWHTEANNPYECRFCKQRFRVNFEIRNHLKFHYNKFECLRCNLVCSRESTLLAHDAYHNGKIKKCDHCNEEFRHQSTYYTHIRTAHRSKYLCNLCGRSFVNELGMRQHKLRKHPEAKTIGTEDTTNANKDVNTYCSTCDIKFETEDAYHEHKLHSSKHIDSNIIIPERKIKRKIPTDCPKCGKQFDSQAACMKHYKNEHPNDKFIPYPELERKHVCELCGATVLYKNLKIHLMNTHEKKNACYCNICGKKFSSGGALKIHSVVHTGEKPYKCTLCDKRFTQKCSMKLHYRTFHLKEPYPKRNRNKILYDLQDGMKSITTK
ncbi:zinc finger protein 765-like isoform X2 [Aricia agestis]|uniref:zinc finger protein 765-like isoform X2 n=1 Tax=Aricia agestis TaxID=91739 RepID=UPI001C2097CB|nr:zinc finger protein 765-like isoform X2 [Aricia agestis]